MIKAIVVGINDYKNFPDQPLKGCINDATDMMGYLTDKLGVAHADIFPLFDTSATKNAIVSALKDVIATLGAGDHLLFHFSGHGAQVPSSSVTEPDGLDEVLCPYDFTFYDRNSALIDKEIAAILTTVPSGSGVTVTVDACHSGDISRELLDRSAARPRFLKPPTDIAWRLVGRKPINHRDLLPLNAVTVSACRSEETAADTAFNGRPNGAFTYNWLACVAAGTKSVDELVTEVAKPLAAYDMHPQIDGAATLRAGTFLQDPPPVTRLLRTRERQSGVRGASVVFDQPWSTKVFGVSIGLELRIEQSEGGLTFVLSSTAPLPLSWTFPVDGNMSQSFDIGLGFKLVATVNGWSMVAGSVSFALTIEVQPPFFRAIRVAEQQIVLPLAALDKGLGAPMSPADLLAMIQLGQLGGQKQKLGSSRDIASGDVPIVVAQGDEGWGPNWREDRLIRVGFLDHGKVRDHVDLGPQQGQGNVYFVGWASDDPTNGDFILHIGNNFFGGWGSIHWVLNGYYAKINDFPRVVQPPRVSDPNPPKVRPRDIASGDVPIVVAQSDEGWGPNWREDRLIRVGFLDHGKVRDHVDLGPQQGQGNVYFVGWASDDPTNGDFILHIGNNFFGGWGSIHWVLNGYYAKINDFPRAVAAPRAVTTQPDAPTAFSNGSSSADRDRRPPTVDGAR